MSATDNPRVRRCADAFDLDLYRLIDRAGRIADACGRHTSDGRGWAEAEVALRRVRSNVFPLLHPDDRAKQLDVAAAQPTTREEVFS
jgi:hypothetical protein